MKLAQKYRQTMEHEHGWPIALTCPTCAHTGTPDYEGWTPSRAIRFGSRATIYADVSCANCGVSLKTAAADELKKQFAGVSTPPRNRMLLGWFAVCIVTAPLALSAALAARRIRRTVDSPRDDRFGGAAGGHWPGHLLDEPLDRCDSKSL